MQVVSLVPSLTETLVRWGRPPVACTRFCEQPAIPAVGGTKNPDVAAIAELAPDLVVMCEEENRREDADALAEAGVVTAALPIEGMDDVVTGMSLLAGLVDVAPVVADDLGAAIDKAVRDAPDLGGLRVFVPIWKRPWMTLDDRTYGSSLLAALGAVNIYGDGGPSGTRYPQVTLEDAASRRPDVVLAPSEPYPFKERHVPLFSDVAPVALVDGQDLFWWGARTPEAIGRLSERLAVVAGS